MITELLDCLNFRLENDINGVYNREPYECIKLYESIMDDGLKVKISKSTINKLKTERNIYLSLNTTHEYVFLYIECLRTEDDKTDYFAKFFIDDVE